MLTKRGRWGIIINVVSARATTTAILENDIVKRDRQERTVRFLRETTVLVGARAKMRIVKD